MGDQSFFPCEVLALQLEYGYNLVYFVPTNSSTVPAVIEWLGKDVTQEEINLVFHRSSTSKANRFQIKTHLDLALAMMENDGPEKINVSLPKQSFNNMTDYAEMNQILRRMGLNIDGELLRVFTDSERDPVCLSERW